MKFKDYLKNLNKLVEEYPESLDYDVVYAKDDEGNGYDLVNYEPGLGHYAGRDEFIHGGDEECGQPNNSVIIN